jgi:hypothetical protein
LSRGRGTSTLSQFRVQGPVLSYCGGVGPFFLTDAVVRAFTGSTMARAGREDQ